MKALFKITFLFIVFVGKAQYNNPYNHRQGARFPNATKTSSDTIPTFDGNGVLNGFRLVSELPGGSSVIVENGFSSTSTVNAGSINNDYILYNDNIFIPSETYSYKAYDAPADLTTGSITYDANFIFIKDYQGNVGENYLIAGNFNSNQSLAQDFFLNDKEKLIRINFFNGVDAFFIFNNTEIYSLTGYPITHEIYAVVPSDNSSKYDMTSTATSGIKIGINILGDFIRQTETLTMAGGFSSYWSQQVSAAHYNFTRGIRESYYSSDVERGTSNLLSDFSNLDAVLPSDRDFGWCFIPPGTNNGHYFAVRKGTDTEFDPLGCIIGFTKSSNETNAINSDTNSGTFIINSKIYESAEYNLYSGQLTVSNVPDDFYPFNFYRKTSSGGSVINESHESFVATGGETNWVLSNAPNITYHYRVTKNGLTLYEDVSGDFTLSTNTVTFNSALTNGDILQIWYKY
ncbi:hypothetical protein [Abyssalbus ytuae]|uniref:Uncharacterized protein n=1 Tax=Abyssalbus ytuae TaxID=2926907 RepID=A0A9E6ZVK5_9FLAO|nr:hypothetical protein [Abyssalbus ytuae]UOB18583.1 hypothetical protein MQE35_04665 [Abyssalbus ytuae]